MQSHLCPPLTASILQLSRPKETNEQQRLSSAYATAAQQQEKARTNDVVGVLLVGLPVSSLSGDNIAPEIARLKGEQEAVRKAMIAKKCELKSS